MPEKPDDRLKTMSDITDEKPKIYVVINGEQFPRPGLETFFVETAEGGANGQKSSDSSQPAAGVYCSCNKVKSCSCVPANTKKTTTATAKGSNTSKTTEVKKSSCGCVGHSSCSCASHRPSSSGGGYGCRCAPVH